MASDPKNPNVGGKYPSSSTGEGSGPLHFRCATLNPQCSWETRGNSEQELRTQIEQHGREKHNMREFTEDMWDRMRKTFRRSAA
jgi:predicted small metal-binding protein